MVKLEDTVFNSEALHAVAYTHGAVAGSNPALPTQADSPHNGIKAKAGSMVCFLPTLIPLKKDIMKKKIAIVGNPFHTETSMDKLVANVIDDAEKQMQKEKEMYAHEQEIGLTRKEREAVLEPVRSDPKIQRNSPCPCGSGKKYKNCCIK